MTKKLLEVKNLSVEYRSNGQKLKAVDNLNFSLAKGESLGLIGESGSGKTSTGLAIMGLIRKPCLVQGQVLLDGEDLNKLSHTQLETIRWRKIATVFQNSLDVLNPLLTIHEQIYEVLIKHSPLKRDRIQERIFQLLDEVGLEREIASSYPHQLSGGMRQKVLIAMALSCKPDLLIVDEPTSSLDMVSKNEIIDLIKRLHRENNFALLLISHELDTVLKLTSNLAVIYSGSLVEEGKTLDIIQNPKHPYTRGLLNSSPAINPFGDMWGIPREETRPQVSGCPFENRCVQKIQLCRTKKPDLEYLSDHRKLACNMGGIVTILQGIDISKTYRSKGRSIQACQDCNIEIKSGEVVALIGESGSGKTSLASILSGILKLDQGQVFFQGKPLEGNNFTRKEEGIQIVLQDPFSSINEQLRVRDVIAEPLKIMKKASGEDLDSRIKKILREVQLPHGDDFISRKCYSLSGGQRQRVSLARSLILRPKLLIADEISSMLDPSTQANILRLLKQLQNQKAFSMLYITHDLAVARKIADRIYVMSQGELVEEGTASKIFSDPENSYTKKLIGGNFNFI